MSQNFNLASIQRVVFNGSDVEHVNLGASGVWNLLTTSGNPYDLSSTTTRVKKGSSVLYKSGSLWKYVSNDSNYNPCSAGWTPNYSSLTCSRVVSGSYSATGTAIQTNSASGPGGPYWWSNGDCSMCVNGYSSAGHCQRNTNCNVNPVPNPVWFSANCWQDTAGWGYRNRYTGCGAGTSYSCPSGGSLSGTTCYTTSTETQPF